MNKNKYIYEKLILIKQTNLFGNTYFSNYFEWQGEAREFFLFTNPAAGNFFRENPNVKLITHSAFNKFIADTHLGDKVLIEVTTRGIQEFSLFIAFRYKVKEKMVSEGWQKICFYDQVAKCFLKIPKVILDLALPVKED